MGSKCYLINFFSFGVYTNTKCACNAKFVVFKEKFEDTKGVVRSRKSKKDRQYNGQKKKKKKTNNDPQNITQKTKAGATS